MFKKLADLFFEDVEIEEEEIPLQTVAVKPEKVKVVKAEKPVVAKEEKEVEVIEQKSFVKPKERSIFIDNSVTTEKKVEKKTQKPTKAKEPSYSFSPIISPIRGVKNEELNDYVTPEVKVKSKVMKSNHLGTVISPIYGVSREEDEEEVVEEVVKDETLLKDDFKNLSLDDLLKSEIEVIDNKDRTHFFIGIKGTGMSALANLLHDAGIKVMGSDTENYVFTQVELLEKNIEIVPFDSNAISSDMIVVRGNSFYADHPDVMLANEVDAIMYDYPTFLGKYMSEYTSVAVSGSHGKTTTTSMISDMLRLNMPTSHLIGDGRGQDDEDSDVIVVEACEYKRHFLSYEADYAVITNLEWDHVDYFKTVDDYLSAFEEFANQIKNTVLVFGDDPYAHQLNIQTDIMYYGENVTNDIYAKNIIETKDGSTFDIVYVGKEIGNFSIKRTGRHMVHNAIAAIGIGLLLGLDTNQINLGLNSYQGARRRFDVVEIDDSVVIDDYAHHPTEVKVTLEAAKTMYPNHKLIAVYHPDRIKRLETFADDYISALSIADQCAVGSAVDSDGMVDIIDTSVLIENLDKSFVVDDNLESVSQLAYLAPAVFVFMGTKEMHHLKVGLIEYLKKKNN